VSAAVRSSNAFSAAGRYSPLSARRGGTPATTSAVPPSSRPTAPSCRPSSTTSSPGLIERRGIGLVSAAQAIESFSHPGRWRNEAPFAALGGVSPLPASSGRTVRYRLNQGGDRALNWALHTIAATRMRSCPTTQVYVARRTDRRQESEGDPALPEAVHRPPALPHPRHRDKPSSPHQLMTSRPEMLQTPRHE